jgi:CubicO group peptidase (beta-lactamase class C family)
MRILFGVLLAFVCLAREDVNEEILKNIPLRTKAFVDDHTVAGVVTMVLHNGKTVELDAEGMADAEAGRPMQKDTIFQIMSMTKPFTGVGIMMLAEEGKLELRDPLDRYLMPLRRIYAITTSR